jgi:ABC-type branched-subunit amino acid transport system substrate-binding protein
LYESLLRKWHEAGNSGDPGMTIVASYDAVLFLYEAAKTSADVEHVATYLRSHLFSGAAGQIKFTETGDRIGAIAIKEIVNGEGKYIEVIDDANR